MAKKTAEKTLVKKATLKKVGIGAGILVASAGAAAAGYYFYASKNAKKHRSAAASWTKGMKRDVLREAKKLKKLDRASAVRIVDEIAQAYENVRGLDKKDLARAAAELKSNWKHLEAELHKAGVTSKKSAKKLAPVRVATKKRK